MKANWIYGKCSSGLQRCCLFSPGGLFTFDPSTSVPGRLLALDAKTGEVLFDYELDFVGPFGPTAITAPIVSKDRVYFGAGYGRAGGPGSTNLFYAFKLTKPVDDDDDDD